MEGYKAGDLGGRQIKYLIDGWVARVMDSVGGDGQL